MIGTEESFNCDAWVESLNYDAPTKNTLKHTLYRTGESVAPEREIINFPIFLLLLFFIKRFVCIITPHCIEKVNLQFVDG